MVVSVPKLFFVVLLPSWKHLAFLFLYRFKCIMAIQKVSACNREGLFQLVIARVFSEAINILRDIS
ncbi:hypothetical protein KsCSTR_19900 [Candidatus Kuenenia stuttgartiensis]|uniref:Uncharacterized protein n=1 Tax=Kuenenia stuttgartiensis TaxID=174633 RepID=Q1Q2N1_KUEST|nr:hypothetical protein KsCSTR_19900 [Candidatus Kuenenia stuttgartiensis]CAJ74268.1 unknown protein [Candidatus Kuenenia stuttgartiensis]